MHEYILRLAGDGLVSLDDLLGFDAGQLHRTYLLLTAGERALSAANAELRGRLAQLESAGRVLQQRTESLISLQEVAQTLISPLALDDLARRISRQVNVLCGADRSILYVMRPDAHAEVLAVNGWDPALVGLRLAPMGVFGGDVRRASPGEEDGGPASFDGYPPGVPARHPDVEGAELRAGLRVPLIAQNEVVGLMIVQSTRKLQFAPGEAALLQAFANQAAMAIQRAGLIEALRAKIAELEAAQAELIAKERLEPSWSWRARCSRACCRTSSPRCRATPARRAASRPGGWAATSTISSCSTRGISAWPSPTCRTRAWRPPCLWR